MGSSDGFRRRRAADVDWLAWEATDVRAAFPFRDGGVSSPPFDSLNLGLAMGDRRDHVLENRRRLCAALGLSLPRLVVPRQVHGTRLTWVDAADAGRGATLPESSPIGDALATEAGGLGLAISYADCVPVVVVADGPQGTALATIHAGWRGMLAGIVGRAAAALGEGRRLLGAAVGPSIGPCCFAVDTELRRRFAARFAGSARAATVDLWACARLELEAAGVPPAAVAIAGLCTVCEARLFSHRRDQGATGRHLAIAWRQEA